MKNILFLILILAYSTTVSAFDFVLQPGELKFLPKYCHAKLDPKLSGPDSMARNFFGHENSRHMHHYCAGLAYIHRGDKAIGADSTKRRFLYERAAAEIGYMEQHMSPDFRIRYELFFNKGYALSKVGRGAEAIIYFQKAIDEEPKYLKAHRAIFDYYFELNQLERATDVITRALEISPNSSSLKRRLKKLQEKKKGT